MGTELYQILGEHRTVIGGPRVCLDLSCFVQNYKFSLFQMLIKILHCSTLPVKFRGGISEMP